MRLPKYPIYVISKGRSAYCMTMKALEELKVPFSVVVEPPELVDYTLALRDFKYARISTLPFSNLGQGSIPARNWVWEDSISRGYARHWIIDDNISEFRRLDENRRLTCKTPALFRAMEDFVDRYDNVALAGPNYVMFANARAKWKPFRLNTRVYSCILIDNDLPYRWRGRYNEDTDLSLRVLKDGLVTVLFNAFLIQKKGTMSMKGGNTESLYKLGGGEDGRLLMARSLVEQHPDVVRITKRFGRYQHLVNYKPFADNRLVRSKTLLDGLPDVDDYGMKLVRIAEEGGV